MTGWEQCFLSPYSGPGWGSHSEQGWSVASHSERIDSPYCLGPVGGAGTCQISVKQKYQSTLHTCMLCVALSDTTFCTGPINITH